MRNETKNALKVIKELATMGHTQTSYPVVIDNVKVFGKLINIRVKK